MLQLHQTITNIFNSSSTLWSEQTDSISASIRRIAIIYPPTIAMAAHQMPSASFLSLFLPVARASLFPAATNPQSFLQQIQQRAGSALHASLAPAIFLPIPTILGDLWNGLLNAVPKKKTSHMKKRHRQMAGKALKDATALNRCSSCGRLKQAHVLCPYCVTSKSFVSW